MKSKVVRKTSVHIVLFVIISLIFIVSCSPKALILDEISNNKEIDINIPNNAELLSSYKNKTDDNTVEDYTSPLKKELDGLRFVLSPYLSADNNLFIGNENKKYIENNFLNPDISNLDMPASDWERVVKLLLDFDDDCASIKTFITDYSSKDKIERQYAVAGLMNLLSLKYSLSLDTDNEDIQKSNVISDMEAAEEKHRPLIYKAFQLGFTDFSVDTFRLFRPTAFLNRGEAISMLYRVFTNLGLPDTNQDNSQINKDTSPAQEDISITNPQQEAYSVENILIEYRDYKNSLLKSKSTVNKKRLDMLNQSEDILKIDLDIQLSNDAINIDEWIEILNKVFGIETSEIRSYITCKTDSILTFDIVAISIFELSYSIGGEEPKDAAEKELAAAREAIPQFDTAEDIDKFARLFSSGMLEGIYKAPGFTPKRPVNRVESLLLIMRIVRGLSF